MHTSTILCLEVCHSLLFLLNNINPLYSITSHFLSSHKSGKTLAPCNRTVHFGSIPLHQTPAAHFFKINRPYFIILLFHSRCKEMHNSQCSLSDFSHLITKGCPQWDSVSDSCFYFLWLTLSVLTGGGMSRMGGQGWMSQSIAVIVLWMETQDSQKDMPVLKWTS